jgi:hypothetical protein
MTTAFELGRLSAMQKIAAEPTIAGRIGQTFNEAGSYLHDAFLGSVEQQKAKIAAKNKRLESYAARRAKAVKLPDLTPVAAKK